MDEFSAETAYELFYVNIDSDVACICHVSRILWTRFQHNFVDEIYDYNIKNNAVPCINSRYTSSIWMRHGLNLHLYTFKRSVSIARISCAGNGKSRNWKQDKGNGYLH